MGWFGFLRFYTHYPAFGPAPPLTGRHHNYTLPWYSFATEKLYAQAFILAGKDNKLKSWSSRP
jgi:hypothetical protein